jgi:hypothetical protein
MSNPARRYSPEEIALVEEFRRRKSAGQPTDSDSLDVEEAWRAEVVKGIAAGTDKFVLDGAHGCADVDPEPGPKFDGFPVGAKRFTFLSDTHGNKIDNVASHAAMKFVEEFKPHYRFAGGDYYELKAFRRGATKDEKRESMREDRRAAAGWLRWYRPTHVFEGNHDVRLRDIARAGNGPLSDYAQETFEEFESVLAELRATYFPYDKRLGRLKINGISFMHGFGNGGQNAARDHAKVYGDCMFGHGHARDEQSVPFDGRDATGHMVPCLCDLDMDFQRSALNTLRHSHGFGFGYFNPDGTHAAYVARITNGKVAF